MEGIDIYGTPVKNDPTCKPDPVLGVIYMIFLTRNLLSRTHLTRKFASQNESGSGRTNRSRVIIGKKRKTCKIKKPPKNANPILLSIFPPSLYTHSLSLSSQFLIYQKSTGFNFQTTIRWLLLSAMAPQPCRKATTPRVDPRMVGANSPLGPRDKQDIEGLSFAIPQVCNSSS